MKTGYLYSLVGIFGCMALPIHSMSYDELFGFDTQQDSKTVVLDGVRSRIFSEVQRVHDEEKEEAVERLCAEVLRSGQTQEELHQKVCELKRKMADELRCKKKRSLRNWLETKDSKGFTKLHSAVMLRSDSEVAWCLENGSDITTLTSSGRHVLFLALDSAIKPVDSKIVKRLILEDVDFLEKTRFLKTKDKKNIMHMLAAAGNYELFRYGFEHVVDQLNERKRNAIINACTSRGMTPLHYAALQGDPDIVGYLINAGADTSVKTYKERLTAMECALIKGHTLATDVFLNDIPADQRTGTLEQCLVRAVEHKSQGAVSRALDLGASSNMVLTDDGDEPGDEPREKSILTYVVEQCSCKKSCACSEIVKVLIDHGADVDAKYGQNKRTALHEAAVYGKLPIVKVLLSGMADVNAVDPYGFTALHEAAMQGHRATVRLLLENGADIYATTYENNENSTISSKTPLDLARMNDRNEVVLDIEDWIKNSGILG